MKPTRIVIVDDHVILRDGIVSIFDGLADFEVVGEAGSVAAAVKAVRSSEPDIVLMDFSLPDGTGLDATREILASNPQTNVVFLTVHEEDDRLFAAVRSGAKGYLLKNIPASEMVARLRGISQGNPAMSPAQTSRILSEFARTPPKQPTDQEEMDMLTERELEVLRQVVTGSSNREIAEQLYISVHTVKNHVHNILDKLHVGSRLQAAEIAVEKGLLRDK
jgi:DNA-binding NarL/FixJ family response regulator